MPDAVIRLSQAQPARRRGRPPGAKNRPKAVISQAQLSEFRTKLGPYLPAADLDYLANVLEGSDKSVLERDLDIFLALQLKALLPQLAKEIEGATLTREATQRSSTVKELLALRFQMQKAEKDDQSGNQYTFIQNIFGERGIDTTRLAAYLGTAEVRQLPVPDEPRRISGTTHDNIGQADEAGAVPVEVLGGSE